MTDNGARPARKENNAKVMKIRTEKFVKETIEGNKLIREYEVKPCSIDMDLIEEFADRWYDPEEAYGNGIMIDFGGDVFRIEVDSFRKAMEPYMEDEDEVLCDKAKQALKMLEPYEGFSIYPDRDEKGDTE